MGYEWDDYEIYPSGNGGNWKSLNLMNLMDGLFENIQNARNPVELNSSSNTPTFWLVLAPDVGAGIALQWIYCQGRYASHGDGSPVLTSQVWFH